MSDETQRVRLFADYYRGALLDTVPQTWWSAEDVFDVTTEQVARWEAAEQAWLDMQSEMHQLINTRAADRRAAVEEKRRKEELRRAEIRRGLYGGGQR